MDLLLNRNFDVELDDRNDLATVEGRRAVEQSIAMMVTSYFYEEIGSLSAVNAVEKIELEAKRVARNNPHIEGVENISARKVTGPVDGTAAIEVAITYETGETSAFEVTE